MLDHADFIARYDTRDALGIAGNLASQLRHDFAVPDGLDGMTGMTSVVIAGMGGSAQGAEFIRNWLGDRLTVPLVIVRDYDLPGFVGPDTLVVAASYSGNTEETLAALGEAERRQARIIVISAGGKLAERAVTQGYPAFTLPEGFQPRFAVLYAVRALTLMLDRVGLTRGAADELAAAAGWLAHESGGWPPDVPVARNPAKRIAMALVGHPVVIYAGPVLGFAAIKWKIAFNENAKNVAFYNFFPELNHNEFTGWLHPSPNGLKVIELRSDLDHAQVQKRFDVTNRLLSSAFAPIEVHAAGETPLEQLVWTIALGEHVATYLAILNQTDPTPVDLVEKFKRELG